MTHLGSFLPFCGEIMVFDPFSVVGLEERESIDKEMLTAPVGKKVFGIDEGLLVGLIIGWIFALAFKGE